MDFTTADNVKKYLNKNTAGLTTDEQAEVDLLIPHVSGVIRNYCGWNVLAEDYNQKFNGNGENVLDLKAYPLNTLTSLIINDIDYTADVLRDDEAGELYFASGAGTTFTEGYRNVEVLFNAGFTVVPSDLAMAATWLVAFYFNRISMENIGVTSEQFNDIKVEYDSTDLPRLVKTVLDRYRRVGIY